MLQFALEVEEVGDGQLPLQIRPKEVRCERGVEASLQGVPRCRAVSVAHAHAGLGANDALDLKTRRRMSSAKTPLGLTLVKYQHKVLQAQMCHPLLFFPKINLKRQDNLKAWLRFFYSPLQRKKSVKYLK